MSMALTNLRKERIIMKLITQVNYMLTSNEPFEIPVYLNDNTELGAIGIKLQITNYNLRLSALNLTLKI